MYKSNTTAHAMVCPFIAQYMKTMIHNLILNVSNHVYYFKYTCHQLGMCICIYRLMKTKVGMILYIINKTSVSLVYFFKNTILILIA